MTLDCLRIAKEIALVSGFFVEGKEADFALLLQVTRIMKIRKICEANFKTSRLLPERGRSQSNEPWDTKQTKRSKSTDHESQTMTIWTRACKHVFPNRSANMIDGTEKPRNPSKFCKRTARNNEFLYKIEENQIYKSNICIIRTVYTEHEDSRIANPLLHQQQTTPSANS